jgi:hypothetical protein
VVAGKPFVWTPRAFGWVDLAVVGLLAAPIYALVTVAREWSGPLQQVPEIHLEARYLPLYALFSLKTLSRWGSDLRDGQHQFLSLLSAL